MEHSVGWMDRSELQCAAILILGRPARAKGTDRLGKLGKLSE